MIDWLNAAISIGVVLAAVLVFAGLIISIERDVRLARRVKAKEAEDKYERLARWYRSEGQVTNGYRPIRPRPLKRPPTKDFRGY